MAVDDHQGQAEPLSVLRSRKGDAGFSARKKCRSGPAIRISGISVGGNGTNTSTGMLTTNGAAPPSRTGVTITNNASVGGVNSVMISTFYGNFAAGHQTYGGTGTVRYTW